MAYNLTNRAGVIIPPAFRGFFPGLRYVSSNSAGEAYLPSPYCKFLFFQMLGGGSGGANCANSAAGQITTGNGGDAGGYSEGFAISHPMGFLLTAGSGGPGALGSFGGASSSVAYLNTDGVSFAGNRSGFNFITAGIASTSVFTSQGGAGLSGIASGTSEIFVLPPNTSVSGAFSNTSFASTSRLGGTAHRVSGTVGCSGKGGDCLFGIGGRPVIAHGNGNPGLGYGSGGSGGMSVNAAGAVDGGDGAQGVIIVWEYY